MYAPACVLVAAAALVSGDAPAEEPVSGPPPPDEYRLIGNTLYVNPAGGDYYLFGSSANPAPADEGQGGVLHCADTYNATKGSFEAAKFDITFKWQAEYTSGVGFADMSDLQTHSGTVTVEAGDGRACFRVPLVDDDLIEGNERFSVLYYEASPPRVSFYLNASSYGGLAGERDPGKLDVVISDNDEVTGIELSLSPESVREGSDGRTATTMVEVTAALTGGGTRTVPTEVTVSVAGGGTHAATADDVLAVGTDFVTVEPITITIPAGMASGTGMFLLEVVGDTLPEEDETIMVRGSADLGLGGEQATSSALLTIEDDDYIDGVSSSIFSGTAFDPSQPAFGATQFVDEGESIAYGVVLDMDPLGTAAITVSSSDPAVTVGKSGETAAAETTLNFTSENWNVPQTVMVTAVEDDGGVNELVELSHRVSGYRGITAAGTATIRVLDNDGGSSAAGTLDLSRTTLEVTEEGMSETYTVAWGLALPPGLEAEVGILPDRSTTAPISVTPSTITFTPDNSHLPQTFTVTATDDDDSLGGTRILRHTARVSASAGDLYAYTPDSVTVAVTDNDGPTGIELSLAPASVTEGSGGGMTTIPVEVTARLTGGGGTRTEATSAAVSVAGGGTGGATAGDVTQAGTDFGMVDAFEIIIPPDTPYVHRRLSLVVVSDTLVEGDETLTITGSAEIGAAQPATAVRTLTIIDDDEVTGIELSLSPDTVAEGDSGTTTTQVAVTARLVGGGTRTAPTNVEVSVAAGGANPATGGGTDFTAAPLSILIPAGTTSATGMLSFGVVGDTLVEMHETLTVTGTADLGGSEPVTATADLTITDDETVPIALSLNPESVPEMDKHTITVTASFGGGFTRSEDTVVTVSVAGGTATGGPGGDYFNDDGGASIPNFDVTILGDATSGEGTFVLLSRADTDHERDKTLMVSGSATADRTFTVTPATLTIEDGGAPSVIRIDLTPSVEEDADTPSVTFTVYDGRERPR